MGYPEGGGLIFADGVPLGALVVRVIYELTGWAFNHLGWWMVLVYGLQGAMAVRLLRAFGCPANWAALVVAAWAVLGHFFMGRAGHISLCSHFFVLWALALHVEDVNRGRWRALEHGGMIVAALLVSPYLAAMAVAITCGTVAALIGARRFARRSYLSLALVAASLVVTPWIAGHFYAGTGAMNPDFGRYSWNPASSVLPPSRLFGIIDVLPTVPREATRWQYEGSAYLGLGPTLVALAAAILVPRQLLAAAWRYRALTVVLAICALFALSNRAYVGSWMVYDVPLPSIVQRAAGLFRSSGRFIWPLSYVLMLAPAVALLRWRRGLAIPAIVLATAIHVAESIPVFASTRAFSRAQEATLVDEAQMTRWMSAHRRLWQFPSWFCGGLGPERYGPGGANREHQLQVLAARVWLPSNSVYMGRHLKSCTRERRWGARPELEPGVLYVFRRDLERAPMFTTMLRSPFCRDVGWGFVCSRQALPD
jgi:hypothetical protein